MLPLPSHPNLDGILQIILEEFESINSRTQGELLPQHLGVKPELSIFRVKYLRPHKYLVLTKFSNIMFK